MPAIDGALDSPPPDDLALPATLSLVIDDPTKKLRSIPTLYMGPARLFGSRDPQEVKARIQGWVDVVRKAHEYPTYTVTACMLDGVMGIYSSDMFNRSATRLKLQRQGIEFADENFLRFTPAGTFVSTQYGEFRPKFLLSGVSEKVTDSSTPVLLGQQAAAFTAFRLGMTQPKELSTLIDLLRSLVIVLARPNEVLSVLRSRLSDKAGHK